MEKKKRGGHRPGAGRKKKPEIPTFGDGGFAARVLGRIGELKLPNGQGGVIKDAEDYSLWLLRDKEKGPLEFARLREKRDGKPVQTVNHLHDKPIQHEHEHSVSFYAIVQKARQRAIAR